ncbi:MAG: TrkA family potassium uptake protein [Elusimicrobia bacterium]|nr:TrkA family potassium uptake protein [Elusimicrobiota bacterium]
MKQVVVIGVGSFGFYLAKELYKRGFEVIAIDKDPARIQEVQEVAVQAIVADSTDIDALRALGIEGAEMVVLGVGTSLSDSILTALNIKDLGVSKVFAKAMSEEHGRILRKIGVTDIVFPEKDLAAVVARKFDNPNMIDYIPFIEGYTIVELAPLEDFIGKKLKEINLTNRFGIQVIAVKDVLSDNVNIVPTGDYMIKDSDVLVLLGAQESIERLQAKGPSA